jgi:hypothetical protein
MPSKPFRYTLLTQNILGSVYAGYMKRVIQVKVSLGYVQALEELDNYTLNHFAITS